MGIYDRSYYRGEEPANWLGSRPLVINLILLNVAVYFAQFLLGESNTAIAELHPDLFQKPWQAWELLTYGFMHSPRDLTHIVFNMIGLFVFGSQLEPIYGRAELLRVYLATLIVAGLTWVVFQTVTGGGPAPLLGASGGVMGMMILYVLHFPRRILLLMGIIPLPGWALGALYVFLDLTNLGRGDNVAHVAHLAGVAFGAIYYQSGMNLGRLVPKRLSTSMFRLRPRLRIHEPQEDTRDLGKQVDEILEKISRDGEASLTKNERRTLEEASRRYQRRRQ